MEQAVQLLYQHYWRAAEAPNNYHYSAYHIPKVKVLRPGPCLLLCLFVLIFFSCWKRLVTQNHPRHHYHMRIHHHLHHSRPSPRWYMIKSRCNFFEEEKRVQRGI